MPMPMVRFRLRLTTLLIGVVFVGLILGLIAQKRAADRREHALVVELNECGARSIALEAMSHLLSNLGVDILKQSSDVELLQVSKGSGGGWISDAAHAVVAPTGVHLGEAAARRMACVLLDYRNYMYVDPDDLPEPKFGLRFRGGPATLDVLLDSSPGSAHQDVWIRIQDQAGKTLHSPGSGWKCMSDGELQKLAESILSQ